jgi:hypothetical protein
MKDFILKLKQKPEHVRKRIALGTSVGVTALVAVIWGTSMAATGVLALGNGAGASDQPAKTDSFPLSGTNVQSNFSQLLGAVGAATNATTAQPTITIVDGGTSSSFTKTANTNNQSATNIPF